MKPNAMNTRAVRVGLWLVLWMALGALVRWIDIGTESLWVDEIYSYRQAIKPVERIIANASSDVHPPVYYILLHWWVRVFDTSEEGLRSLSLLCSVLTIPLIYMLGARLWNVRTGLFAALLLSVSHFHIHYAQEARSYAYLVLVSVAGMLTFVVLLDDVRASGALRARYVIAYILAQTVLMYSHFFALYVIIAQNAYLLVLFVIERRVWRRLWWQWSLIQALLALLFTPWLRVLLKQIQTVKSGFWIAAPTMFSLAETIIEYAGSLSSSIPILILFVLAFVEIRRFNKRYLNSDGGNSADRALPQRLHIIHFSDMQQMALVLLWFAMPILLPFVQSLLSTPIYYVKYTIPALPAFLLIVAKGFDAWEEHSFLGKGLTVLFVVVVCSTAALSIRNDWNALEKELWKEASAYLIGQSEQAGREASFLGRSDIVFVHDWYCTHNLNYYGVGIPADVRPLPPERLRLTPEIWKRLYTSEIVGRDRLWLVLSHKTRKTSEILDTIQKEFICVRDTIFPSRYRKYMIRDSFPFATEGIFLMKTYLSNDIRILCFERKNKDRGGDKALQEGIAH